MTINISESIDHTSYLYVFHNLVTKGYLLPKYFKSKNYKNKFLNTNPTRNYINKIPELNNVDYLFLKTHLLSQTHMQNHRVNHELMIQFQIPYESLSVSCLTSNLDYYTFPVCQVDNGGGILLCLNSINVSTISKTIEKQTVHGTIQGSMLKKIFVDYFLDTMNVYNFWYYDDLDRTHLKYLNLKNLLT